MRITVVGAGIVGLTAALHLREAGHDVSVVAERSGEQTTSAVAAALWLPYLAMPRAAVSRWAGIGLRALSALAVAEPSAGVDLRTGRQLFREATADPWWAMAGPPLRRLSGPELSPGFVDGIELTVPVVDTPAHLAWLVARLRTAGVGIERARVTSLDDAGTGADVVVNCTGLGARELAGDADLRPVRGQVVLVEQLGVRHWTLDDAGADLTYVVPRRSVVVVGGTAEPDDDELRARPDTTAAILQRATELVPELAGAAVLGVRVGLRPARPAVRLERTGDVVHCYGHGGAGVTLAYGCARDIVGLVSPR